MGMPESKGWPARFARRTKGEVGGGLASILALANATDLISFAGGFPDPATFPGEILADLLRDLLRGGDASAMQYAPTEGLPGPRAFMRERLGRLEGREPAEDALMITSGAVEALELIGKSFLDPGDEVLVESPTYLGAIMAFRSFEARVTGVRVDADGLDIGALEERLLGTHDVPKLLYAIPDHQNPTGESLSADRRRSLVEMARHHGVLLIEDVAYRELGFTEDRLPSLWSLAPDVVVQIGTFSKTFFPGVRLGWAAGPADVIRQLTLAKQNTDQCASAVGQRLLEEYGRRGLLDVQVARARELYGRRCQRFLAALDEHVNLEGVTWTRPRGGFFSWMTLPDRVDTTDLARLAMAERVAFVPGAPFYPEGGQNNRIRLAYSRIADEAIDEGVRRLGSILRAALARG